MKRICYISLCLGMCHSGIFAQPPELITDRPDQTESSAVVPPGYVQLEAGWLYTREDVEGVEAATHELPGTLIRIGLVDRVELRLGWVGYILEEIDSADANIDEDGVGDGEIGTKLYFWEENDWIPETALLASLSLPFGRDEFTSDRADPSFRFSMSHTLSETLSLGYNVGMEWETEPGEDGEHTTRSSGMYTVALGYAFSDRWGLFVEFYGDVALSAKGGPSHSFDGGLTYLLRDNLQLDLAGGVGISDAADDYFVGAGLSALFPLTM